MRMSRKAVIGLGVCLLGGAMALSGCSTATTFRMDPSPEIQTTGESGDEVRNSLTLINDTNFRYFWKDMGRLMLMNRRSHLGGGPTFDSPY